MALSDPAITVLLCMAAYLGGSVLFALPVCRLWALPDPRAQAIQAQPTYTAPVAGSLL